MAIALTLISVCCGCLGAVMALDAGFGLLPALISYVLAGAMGSGLTVIWAMSRLKPVHASTPSASQTIGSPHHH
ncbi:MAG: hypothetical protein ABJL99_27065 [Aliishimia sp.]